MSSGIHIHVGGGSATFGNVVQGDHNTVGANRVQGGPGARFDRLIADLPALARPYDRPDAEIARLTQEIERLKQAATAATPDTTRGGGILKTIRDNFGWAWPAVKDVVGAAWPLVLQAI